MGIRSTAGVVTSAAIVMVGVFAVFATLSMLMFKQFGVGLATAILIDATIVRGVLLPASMKLLGDWNWYLPRWLEWLPRFDAASPSLGRDRADPARRPRGDGRRLRAAAGGRSSGRHSVRSCWRPACSASSTTGTHDVSLTAGACDRARRRRAAIALGAVSKRRVRGLLPFGVVLSRPSRGGHVACEPLRRHRRQGRAAAPCDAARAELRVRDRPLHGRPHRRRAAAGYDDDRRRARHGRPARQVPEHAALEIRAHADGGQVTVLGRTDEGTRPDEHAVARGSTSMAPRLELDAEVGFGHLAVRRG